jgi:hypothetical protein
MYEWFPVYRQAQFLGDELADRLKLFGTLSLWPFKVRVTIPAVYRGTLPKANGIKPIYLITDKKVFVSNAAQFIHHHKYAYITSLPSAV